MRAHILTILVRAAGATVTPQGVSAGSRARGPSRIMIGTVRIWPTAKGAAVRIPAILVLLLAGAYLMRNALLNTLLFLPRRELDATPADGGLRYEELTLATADGCRLQAWWMPARVRPALGHVLFCHGNAGNISHRIVDAQLLVAEGFDVLLFDYRGYGRSTGRPSEAGTYLDARAALAALRSRPEVDPKRIFYLGESLGGAVAIELATFAPPAGLVLRSAFTDIDSMARRHYPLIPRFVVPDAYPSLRRIRTIRSPVLVIHGDADTLIPLAHGQALYEAAAGPKQLEVIPRAGHNDIMAMAGLRLTHVIGDWARGLR
jgi:uncharacterized protein